MSKPVIDPDRLLEAAKDSMFGPGTDNPGFCTECGEEQDGCEPDARNYECESCGAMKVSGAQELVIMGYAN